MKSKSIAIVGAGPGGLAAAMLLAARGVKVTIFERQPVIGGRTSSIQAEGFKFDVGPTFFLYPRALEAIFRECGRDLHREVEMVRLDPQYRIQFGAGGKIDATPDIPRMESEIAGISPEDARKFRRFLTENRVRLEAFRPVLEREFLSFGDIFRADMLKALPHLRPHQSVDDYLRTLFHDPRIRLAFSFQSKYLGMSPFRCPSLFSILSFLEYEHGVWHPMGGCAAVTETMARAAQEMGVEIRTDEPVLGLDFKGRRATAVRTNRGVHAADAVVVNADFARAMHRLIPDRLRSRWSDRKLRRKRFSCSTFMLYLGVEGRYDLPHHTIHIAEDYERNLGDIEERHILSDDPSFYVQNACVTDPSLAPRDASTLYILAPVSHRHANIDWAREKGRYRDLLLRQIAKAGYDGVENRIQFEKVVTPDDWDTGHEIHLGATFNLAHNLGQLLHNRPRNRFEDVDGLYLVGGGTHPGSGLPVIFEGARITSRVLLRDLGIASQEAVDSEAESAAIRELEPVS